MAELAETIRQWYGRDPHSLELRYGFMKRTCYLGHPLVRVINPIKGTAHCDHPDCHNLHTGGIKDISLWPSE